MAGRVEEYLERLEHELEDVSVDTCANAVVDAREFLTNELWRLRRERPELREDEAFDEAVAAFGSPEDVARAYRAAEQPARGFLGWYRRMSRYSYAPGWRIACGRCGRAADYARSGPFTVRWGARSIGKRVLGWCSECRRLRFLRVYRETRPKPERPRRQWLTRVAPILVALTTVLVARPAEAQSLLAIERFEIDAARDPLPEGWSAEVGARSGDGPVSRVLVDDGTLVLEGDATTGTWRYLTHPLPAKPGDHLRLAFEARLADARVDRFQFDNHFVALEFKDAAGRRLGRELLMASASGEWSDGTVIARVPERAAKASVGLFLSHTGRLAVRRLSVERLLPEASFDVLVHSMAMSYSHFATNGVDWTALTGRFRERALAAPDAAAFAGVLREMLSELEDGHVWIQTTGAGRIATHVQRITYNADAATIRARVTPVFDERGLALVGRTAEGFGYVGLGTFEVDPARFARVEEAVHSVLDAPGLIIDVRANGGGNELLARRIAGLFTDVTVVYSLARVRNGPEPTQLSPPFERKLEPAGAKPYSRPIVCLTGPGCVSSCEGFAQMMKALPHVTVVGQPTRGSSGNPAPVSLPNGVVVYFSRWVSLLPDGTPIERVGVPPDVLVEPTGEGDPTLEAGVRELSRRVDEEKR